MIDVNHHVRDRLGALAKSMLETSSLCLSVAEEEVIERHRVHGAG